MIRHDDAGLSAMEGDGFYNKNSALQAAGITQVLPVWEEACRTLSFGDEPLVIGDYGCSQGRNSLIPMRIAINAVRSRAGASRPIQILHTDLPNNDFPSLFSVITEDPDSYLRYASGIFPMAIGRSYFEQIVPDNTVHLVWNTWTLHWMSRASGDAPDAIAPKFSKQPAVLAAAAARHEEDWSRFLEFRGRELRPGGKLLTCFAGFEDSQGSGWEEIMADLWEAAMDLGRDGYLSREELTKLTMPVSPRYRREIKAPFGSNNRFGSLSLKWLDMLHIKDPLWPDYEANRDARKLGEARANGVRAWAAPAIKNCIDPKHDRDALVALIFDHFADRLTATPRKLEVYLAAALIQKDV